MKYIENYHTHCYLCRHAKGTVEDYIKKAIEYGMKTIGMSDHAPFPYIGDRSIRMDEDELSTYIQELEKVKETYGNQIRIVKGLEVEYYPEQESYIRSLYKQFEYLILGQHYIQIGHDLKSVYHIKSIDELRRYKEETIQAMSTKMYRILAHPDILLYNQGVVSDEVLGLCQEIIDAAIQYDVYLEINANGFRKPQHVENGVNYYRYPRKAFWELVSKSKAKVVIGADAHHPDHLKDAYIEQAMKFAKDLSIEVEEELVF